MESFTSVYYACMKQFGCVILYCLVVSRVFTTVLDLGSRSFPISLRHKLSANGSVCHCGDLLTSWVIRVLQLIAKACRQHV